MNLAAINDVCKWFSKQFCSGKSMMKNMIMFPIFRAWAASLTEASARPQKQCLSPQILRYVYVHCLLTETNWKVGTVLVKWACNTRQCIESHNFWLNAYFFSFHLPSVLCMCPSERIQFFNFPTWHEQTFNFNLIPE